MVSGRTWPNRIWWEQWSERRLVRWTARLAFAAVVTLLLTQFKLDPLEFMLYDWRARVLPPQKASGEIVLIGIDNASLTEMKRTPTAKDLATTLQRLKNSEPAALVSLVRPTEFLGSASEAASLAALAKQIDLIYGEADLPAPGTNHLMPLPPPFQAVKIGPAPITRDPSPFPSSRGISRRVILRYQGQWTLQAQLAALKNHISALQDYHGVFRYLESDQTYVEYKKGFQSIRFSDVLSGNFDRRLIKDKIVLIGRNSSGVENTFLSTPIAGSMSPLFVQANYIDSLIMNSSPKLTPIWCTAGLTFLLSVLTMLIVMRLKPISGLSLLAGSVVAVVMLSLFLKWEFNLFFPVAAPMIGAIMCYYFVLPYRLILENRRSWEYYEKNRMLTKVEELKSNFIRMMSHDLKTPLARIQAMAEIVMQEPDKLTAPQIEALHNITASSEDLTQWIGSVINLSRIQSKDVKLRLQTRDVTQLLSKVIRGCDYLSRRKNIRIVTEFEPLFSLRMDEDLMKQVFTNLIENALKYSPEGTEVAVSAREIGGRVEIQIRDQGIGIPKEDLGFVFERFYRAQNAEYENSGTGLGLYLAKYFTSLHGGTVEVQSETGKGSTFSVYLPLELEEENVSEEILGSKRPREEGATHV